VKLLILCVLACVHFWLDTLDSNTIIDALHITLVLGVFRR
jgi:hypothetical protein